MKSAPALGTGEVNEGMQFDFYANGQQLTAADDYVSIGDCGLAEW